MKKLISMILASVIIFSAFPVFSEAMAETQNDSKITEILLAVEAIDAVGTIDAEVTRGEFAAYVANMLFNSSLQFVKVQFADVPQNHTYYREISLISDLGAMKGRDTHIFAPDDTITFNEAIKVIVSAMGYGDIAEAKGGYPYGYVAVANDLDITDGINTSGNLTNGDVYNLLYNCLEVNHMIATSYDNIDINLEKSNITFLSGLGFSHIENVTISSNAITSIYGASPAPLGFFVADGVRYKDMTGNSYSLIGCTVDMYYNNETASKPVTYLEASDDTRVLEVRADDIISLTSAGMTYENGTETKTVKFAPDTDCIYNYVLSDFASLTVAELDGASVKCIGTGSGYDIVHIFKYTDYYVQHINYDENKFIDKLTNQVVDFDDFDAIFVAGAEEKALSFDDIKQDQLISIANPKNGSVKVVVRSDKTVGGKIDQVSASQYYINNSPITVTDALAVSEYAPRLGDMGTFFLNPNGHGAMFAKTTARNYKYGYIIAGKISTDMDKVLKLRILDETGRIIEAESKKDCVIDGVKRDVSDSRFSSLYINWLEAPESRQPMAIIQPQLIRYTIDSDGKLSMIDTEYTDSLDNPDGLVSKNGLLADLTGRPYYHTFENKIAVGTDGIQFWVPDDLSITDEKRFKVVTGGVADNRDPDVKPYDENDVNYSPAVVCYEPAGAGVATSGTLFLVGEVSKCIVDEEEVYKVKGLYNNEEKECYITYQTMRDYVDQRKAALEPGDIMTCNISDAGYITAFTMRYNIDDRYNFESGLPYNMNWLTENYYMTATVRNVDDVFFRLSYGWKKDLTDDFVYSAENIVTQQYWAPFYLFDEASGEYRKASLGDLRSYADFGNEASRVYVYFNWGQCACVVIVNLDE